MEKIVTVAEMQAVEREANEHGLSYAQMMENAGQGVADHIRRLYDRMKTHSVIALVGSGNNGGDALVALSYLVQWGWKATAYIVRPRSGDDALIARLVDMGGEVINQEQDPGYITLRRILSQCEVLVDGVLGTGTRLPLKPEIALTLGFVQDGLAGMEKRPVVVAVDCPSGVDCDTGEAAQETIPADLTITMAAIKIGNLSFPTAQLTGEIRVVKIGDLGTIESWNKINRHIIEEEDVKKLLPPRPRDAHKGTFGVALIVGGSVNYTGAVLLAAKAAFRVGAGWVTIAAPEPVHTALAGSFLEATWILLPHEMGVIHKDAAKLLLNNVGRATAILIGPGLGLENTTGEFINSFICSPAVKEKSGIGFVTKTSVEKSQEKFGLPALVFDADGLKLLARIDDWHTFLPAQSILTPHPGEMAVLTGIDRGQIQANRMEIAEKFAHLWGHVVVLKGPFTIIAGPDGRTAMIPVATSALARAGTGDVLAGLITGLRAQGVAAFESAVTGAWIHAYAGLEAAEKIGNSASVLAGDVLQSSITVLSRLYK